MATKKYTIEQAKQWAEDRSHELDGFRVTCDSEAVQFLNRIVPQKSKELWDSGCWLGQTLRDLGATEDQASVIGMAHGQRSFGGDAWQVAVDYANEFAATGDTNEKGGPELAEKRNRELFGED